MHSFMSHKSGKEDLIKLIEDNDSITITANFELQQLNKMDIKKLVGAIKNNSHLETLSLNNCSLKSEDAILIVEAVMKNKHLTKVDIEIFENDSANFKQIINEMNHHLSLNKIDKHSSAFNI